jgi:histidine triad (HIT) family protein
MSIAGAYDGQNIFAKILCGEMPCVKVFEDDVALAFMDLFPQAPGHCLVIPKHAEARNLLDMPAAGLGPLMERVQIVARAVQTALAPDGIRIFQLNGAPAGQTVFHLHFHVLPAYEGRNTVGHGHAQKADPADLEALAARIRAAI